MTELIKIWSDSDYKLKMWDCGKRDGNRVYLDFKFYYKEKVMFENTYSPSPMFEINSWETVADLLDFLSTKPGYTDAEHFEDYTKEQLAFVKRHGDELSLLAKKLEDSEDD